MKNEYRLSALYLSAFPRLCRRYGVEPQTLTSKLNIQISTLHDENQELSHQQFAELLNLAAKETQDPLFALELSTLIDYQSLDIAMLLIASQESLANIYPVLFGLYSYQQRASRHQLDIRDDIARHFTQFLFEPNVDTSQHALLSIGGIITTFKMILGERLKLHQVHFKARYQGESGAQQQTQIERIERFFGCKVILGSQFDGFEFPKALLAEKPDLEMTITNQMRRKVSHGLQHHNTLLEITTNSILLLLPLGDISKTLVSKMLGIHPRTLQNLLNKNNLTYRDIVNSVRDTESKKLLTNSEYPIRTIADMLCYASADSFIRKFKRTNGITPLQYRKQHCV
ncbi:hypothetical protein VoSk93_31250 [Vibrio owensii]